MKIGSLTTIAAVFVFAACSSKDSESLSYQPPVNWKVEQKTLQGNGFFSLSAGTTERGLLICAKWPAPAKPEDIPALMQQVADGFLRESKKSSKLTLTSEEYHVEQFVGDHCQGRFATFQFKSGATNGLAALFFVSANHQIWNGQFIGQPEAWLEALGLLKSLK